MRAAAAPVSSIPKSHKREQYPGYKTMPVKTKLKSNGKRNTPIMSLVGGWVGERTQSQGRPAPASDLFPLDG